MPLLLSEYAMDLAESSVFLVPARALERGQELRIRAEEPRRYHHANFGGGRGLRADQQRDHEC